LDCFQYWRDENNKGEAKCRKRLLDERIIGREKMFNGYPDVLTDLQLASALETGKNKA